jgi:hypothetical protein
VLSKLTLLALLVVFIGKVGFRKQLRELGKRVDGLVNVMLVAIAISYGVQLVFWWNR